MDKSGYVYLVKSTTGHWKIGRTVNPHDRMRTFNVKLPIEVEYDHLIQCYNTYKMESELHTIFASRRLNGEWFDLDGIDVKWIRTISDQVHFDVRLSTINESTFHVADLSEADVIKRMRRGVIVKGGLFLLLSIICAIGIAILSHPIMGWFAAEIVIASFTLMVIIGSDALSLYRKYDAHHRACKVLQEAKQS